ncbi:MAG: DUF58 domain-containing protein [Chloroflexi bacterium]|nr:DUF58 domain-containing protein [Chloroflexota bacterium]
MSSCLRQLLAPWVLWRVRDNQAEAEVVLLWRNRTPLIMAGVLLLVQLTTPARVWMTLLLAFTVTTAIAGIWSREMAKNVRVHRRLPTAWVQTGDLIQEEFTVRNDSLLPALCLEIEDQSDVPGYVVSTVRSIGAQSSVAWVSRGESHLRGEYQMGPWVARTCDPFGLFEVVQRCNPVSTVLVYPPIAQRLPFALPRGAAEGRARVSERSWNPTATVGGVRGYLPGDPRQHIHWPTSVRHMELYTKEFDQESGGDIWVVLDLDRTVQVGVGERSTEEFGVIVAASIAALLLDAGRAVGMITHGADRSVVTPARGRGHLWAILRALAQARAVEFVPLAGVLTELARVLPVGATALVVTPSSDVAWIPGAARLQAKGIGVAALLMDSASFDPVDAVDELGAREALQAQAVAGSLSPLQGLLADVRVESEVITADMPLALRPPTGQLRRWEFKVGGTGRAVAVNTPWGVR